LAAKPFPFGAIDVKVYKQAKINKEKKQMLEN
jgi:hypothetical protein